MGTIINSINHINSFLHLNETSKEYYELYDSLNNIYKIFSVYQKPSANLTCLDYGPSKEEQETFETYGLLELPDDFIEKLEFYDETWLTWGTEEEVKFFMPRILDRITMCLRDQNECFVGPQSIIYKLSNLEDWKPEEQKAIRSFFRSLVSYFIKYGNLNLVDDVFNFIFSIKDTFSVYLAILEGASSVVKEKVFNSIFKSWLDITIQNKYYIKYNLKFKNEKERFLNEILNNKKLIKNLECLYIEPWDNLILKGVKTYNKI